MATTKATTLAHTLGGISSDISTAEINRLDNLTGDIQTQLDAKLAIATASSTYAPLASPTFTGTTNISSGATFPSNPTITLGSNTTFPAGHIINWAYGTDMPSSDTTIGDSSDYHYTGLSCNLVTTSTSNKMVVQLFIPDVYNLGSAYNALHVGFRYNIGSFDSASSVQIGGEKFVSSYNGYLGTAEPILFPINTMVVATVPAVNTLKIYPILLGSNGGVHIYDNASNADFDEGSIIAYEVKQ